MARGRPKKLDSRKYTSALSCVAWPNGEYAVIAGGGGRKSSGIPNRVIVISCKGDAAGEEVADLQTTDAPYQMVLSLDSKVLLVAMLPAGLMWINIENSGGIPKLTARTGDIASKLKKVGAIRRLCFSGDSRLVALAKDDGTLEVYEFPSFQCKATLSGEGGQALTCRHLTFSAAHGNRLLAVVDDGGVCTLWHWEKQLQLRELKVSDAGLKTGRMERCFFGDIHDRQLYTSINSAGTSYLVAWQQNLSGEIDFLRRVKVADDAVSTFEVSPNCRMLALGSMEGDVFVYDSGLQRLKAVKGQHLWYVAALGWAQDSHAVLSVSGGASALVTAVQEGAGSSANFLAVLTLLLIALVAMAVKLAKMHLL